MSPPSSDPPDWNPGQMPPSLEQIFGLTDPDPYELHQTVHRYLSQDTRHDILQVILGHPQHLVSVTEFAYYLPKSRSTISEQLSNLASHQIIQQHHYEPNVDVRNLPADFWGLTELGVNVLTEFKHLRGLPILRAVHDSTHKPERIQRHEAAPRPALPAAVAQRLDYPEPDADDELSSGEESLADLREESIYAEAASDTPRKPNETNDGPRSLDELF